MSDVSNVIEVNNFDPMALYKYGLYANSVAGEIKKLDLKAISESYAALVVKCRKEIDIDSQEYNKYNSTLCKRRKQKQDELTKIIDNDVQTIIDEDFITTLNAIKKVITEFETDVFNFYVLTKEDVDKFIEVKNSFNDVF